MFLSQASKQASKQGHQVPGASRGGWGEARRECIRPRELLNMDRGLPCQHVSTSMFNLSRYYDHVVTEAHTANGISITWVDETCRCLCPPQKSEIDVDSSRSDGRGTGCGRARAARGLPAPPVRTQAKAQRVLDGEAGDGPNQATFGGKARKGEGGSDLKSGGATH